MISKKFQSKIPYEQFTKTAQYLGVSINTGAILGSPQNIEEQKSYTDLEMFILSATYNLKTSRMAEGILCWLLQYGTLLSPSKLRRLIIDGTPYESAILGAFIKLMIEHKIQSSQLKILTPFIHKKRNPILLFDGPAPIKPSPYFKKYGVLAPNFKLEVSKFLKSESFILNNCPEIRFRYLFGSIVNADIASYLLRNTLATPYEIAKGTHHHKARVFSVYPKIKAVNFNLSN